MAPPPQPTAPARAPRLLTLVNGLALVAAVLGLLAVVSPTVRDQLALSLTRQDPAYVETFFTDVDRVVACNPGRPRFLAEVGVRSHLQQRAALPWTMELQPTGGGRTRTATGEVATAPDQLTRLPVALRKPRGAFTARIDFPSLDQQLVVHCEAVR